jgi:hypothetical protein
LFVRRHDREPSLLKDRISHVKEFIGAVRRVANGGSGDRPDHRLDIAQSLAAMTRSSS